MTVTEDPAWSTFTATERAETLLRELQSCAQNNGSGDRVLYEVMRAELLSHPDVPRFLRTCRSLGVFWSWIKEKGSWHQRSKLLEEAFAPLLATAALQATSSTKVPSMSFQPVGSSQKPRSPSHKLFVSHSSRDASRVVTPFVEEFLSRGLGFNDDEIFYTSSAHAGHRVPSGTFFPDHIRSLLREGPATIAWVTEAYLGSPATMMELGAAWAMSSQLIIVLDDTDYGRLGALGQGVASHALPSNLDAMLHELADSLTPSQPTSSSRRLPAIEKFKALYAKSLGGE